MLKGIKNFTDALKEQHAADVEAWRQEESERLEQKRRTEQQKEAKHEEDWQETGVAIEHITCDDRDTLKRQIQQVIIKFKKQGYNRLISVSITGPTYMRSYYECLITVSRD